MILVTGATGRLGGHVVRALRKLGQPARALVRKGSEYFWLNDTGAAYFFGDLRDARSLDRACAGVKYVIACSGVEHETRDNDHTRVTVDGHAALWAAAKGRGVERIVYISAMGVDRGYPIPWFDAKKKAEDSLAASGVPFAILRPAPFTRVFAELARQAARSGSVWLPGPATNELAPIGVPNLALYAIAALDLEAANNRAIEVAGPETMTAREAVERAIALGGEPGTVHTMPASAAKVAARLVRPIGRRWEHKLKHKARWFTDPFTAPMAELVAATGIELTGYDAAIQADFAEIIPLEDPDARDERVVHQKFEATIYEPGEVDYESLPSGPLRYE
jgi:uncharacterized protein YbjT (DUF2867 family)